MFYFQQKLLEPSHGSTLAFYVLWQKTASVQDRGCFYGQSPGMKQSKCPVMEFTNKQQKRQALFMRAH